MTNMKNSLPEDNNDITMWTVASHLSAFLGLLLPLLFILAPLGIWVFKGKTNKEIERHARESFNFQLSVLIYGVGILLLTLLMVLVSLLGFLGTSITFTTLIVFAGILLMLLDFVCVIMASITAYRGYFFKYPFNIRFIK